MRTQQSLYNKFIKDLCLSFNVLPRAYFDVKMQLVHQEKFLAFVVNVVYFLQDDVNCSLEYDDRTPLHIAATNGNLSMVQTLLEYGASLQKFDKYGATPLLDAIRFKRIDVIR